MTPLEPTPETATRVVLRPLANPLPLGFLALAVATLSLSAGYSSGGSTRRSSGPSPKRCCCSSRRSRR